MSVLRSDAVMNFSSNKVLKLQDLHTVENNLSRHEKISVLFLLYAYEDPVKGYDKLLQLLHEDRSKETYFLTEWASSCRVWDDMIREALLIIQAFAVINMLGLSKDDECSRFLPHNNECSIYIHPMIKVLYHVCENLTHETPKFIRKVRQRAQLTEQYFYAENLEVHLMSWIKEKVISVGPHGGWSKPHYTETADVTVLLNVLKLLNIGFLYEILINTQNRLNKYHEKFLQTSKIENIMKINQLNIVDSTNPENISISSSSENYSLFGNMKLANDAERLASFDKIIHKKSVINGNLSSMQISSEYYALDPENMGLCLIIDQIDFAADPDADIKIQQLATKLETRDGTEKDSTRLKSVFESYGYRVLIKKNLKNGEMMKAIKHYASCITSKDSSFIVCILSHGHQGAVFGTNCIPVEISIIVELMRSESLCGKPSILVIQACQNYTQGEARENENLMLDSPKGLQSASNPRLSDFLVYLSTVEGFASVRDTETGSWFVQELCKVLEEYGDQYDIVQLITEINRRVTSKVWKDSIMVPIYNSCFRKNFRFPPNCAVKRLSNQI